MGEYWLKHVRTPIVLFQMGKVGSSALKLTLSRRHPGLVMHAHRWEDLTPTHQSLLSWRLRLRLPVYVICPIREPLSRNVSAFFQTFRRDTGMALTDRPWTVPELQTLFLERYPHSICLEWFDRHLRSAFGIDVFAQPFDIQRKWQTYRRRALRLLIYRADLEHGEQLNVLSQFLGYRIEKWDYDNVTSSKEHGELYAQFCADARLPESYLEWMGNSRFCRQFWSAAEIAGHARRWRGESAACGLAFG